MSALAPEEVPEIVPLYRLQWEEVQQAHVLLFPEGMIRLSPSAGEILKRVDGSASVREILADLEAAFPGADLRADVLEFMEVARVKGWIRARRA